MSTPDTDKLLALFAEQQAQMDAELEKLGFGDLENFYESQMMTGYPDIVRQACDAPQAELANTLQKLILAGADVNEKSPYGETALDCCFRRNAIDAMRVLLRAGADDTDFEWNADHRAIVMGDMPSDQPDVSTRNAGGRTLFLQACRFGHIAAAEFLLPLTPEASRIATPDGDGPLHHAARSGSIAMLDWVLAQGFDVNETDDYGGSALLDAVMNDDLALATKLLEAGADPLLGRNVTQQMQQAPPKDGETDNPFLKASSVLMEGMSDIMGDVMTSMEDHIMTPAENAYSPEMIRLLVQHGVPADDFDTEHFASVVGADQIPETAITPDMFAAQSAPREGRANPELVDVPFWREQIRTGRSASSAIVDCLGKRAEEQSRGPTWSFHRFGRTSTRLADGRWVLIAGEHEDHYDPDFCIYADVTVISPDHRVDHFIYPHSIFPPTDFHTATVVKNDIIMIGNLGYHHARKAGETQVLQLSLDDFSIHPIQTTGQNPGWISRHTATLNGDHIIVSGGVIEPGYADNTDSFVLDLNTLKWTKPQ